MKSLTRMMIMMMTMLFGLYDIFNFTSLFVDFIYILIYICIYVFYFFTFLFSSIINRDYIII